jgi:rhodanese-related sulfurtransferase
MANGKTATSVLSSASSVSAVSVPVVLGRIFHDAITDILSTLADIGKLGVLSVLAVLGLYLLVRWWRRQAFIRQLRMNRITVDELRGLIDRGRKLLILDVRPQEAREEGMIPGAVPVPPEDIDPVVKTHFRELEIVVYCACPNEALAAVAAKHLKQAGFKKIRPLLGGIDAWVQAGQPVERARPFASTATS